MSKTPKMELFLDNMAKEFFGHSRKDPCCVTCGSKEILRNNFKDDLSWKEWAISRMCQRCQDEVFNGEEV